MGIAANARKLVGTLASAGDVKAPRNIRAVVNVGRRGGATEADAVQEAPITQVRGERRKGSSDRRG